jgi:hypothetical protein
MDAKTLPSRGASDNSLCERVKPVKSMQPTPTCSEISEEQRFLAAEMAEIEPHMELVRDFCEWGDPLARICKVAKLVIPFFDWPKAIALSAWELGIAFEDLDCDLDLAEFLCELGESALRLGLTRPQLYKFHLSLAKAYRCHRNEETIQRLCEGRVSAERFDEIWDFARVLVAEDPYPQYFTPIIQLLAASPFAEEATFGRQLAEELNVPLISDSEVVEGSYLQLVLAAPQIAHVLAAPTIREENTLSFGVEYGETPELVHFETTVNILNPSSQSDIALEVEGDTDDFNLVTIASITTEVEGVTYNIQRREFADLFCDVRDLCEKYEIFSLFHPRR